MQKEKQLKQENPSGGEICQQLYVVMIQPTGAARSTTMYQCRRPAFTDGWVYKAVVGFFTFKEKFDCRNTTTVPECPEDALPTSNSSAMSMRHCL